MRENRPYGSEGGVARAIPTPIRHGGICGRCLQRRRRLLARAWSARLWPGPSLEHPSGQLAVAA